MVGKFEILPEVRALMPRFLDLIDKIAQTNGIQLSSNQVDWDNTDIDMLDDEGHHTISITFTPDSDQIGLYHIAKKLDELFGDIESRNSNIPGRDPSLDHRVYIYSHNEVDDPMRPKLRNQLTLEFDLRLVIFIAGDFPRSGYPSDNPEEWQECIKKTTDDVRRRASIISERMDQLTPSDYVIHEWTPPWIKEEQAVSSVLEATKDIDALLLRNDPELLRVVVEFAQRVSEHMARHTGSVNL